MRPKQRLKPNCAQAQAGQSKSPVRQIYEDRAKNWALYVTFKHPSKKRGCTKSEKPRREKTPPKKGDTVCPKKQGTTCPESARRKLNLETKKSPSKKTAQQKKHQQKRGHGVSQKTRHDVPRTRKPKTYLGDEGVPRAHHPPQLPTQLLLPGCRLLLNITGETKHRAAKSRRDDASQKNKGGANENGTKT